MKFGVIFPQTEIGVDPVVIRDYAQTAEGLGYDYILTFDHVVGANPDRPGGWSGPYDFEDTIHEPFVLYAYMAGLTERIGFTTGIMILPELLERVAKQKATYLRWGRDTIGWAIYVFRRGLSQDAGSAA